MFHRIFILVTLCVYCKGTNNIRDPVFRKDYTYVEEADGWLKLHFRPMPWKEARAQCIYEGALLASPLTKQMQAGIAKYLQYKRVNPKVMHSGVSSILVPGIYQSLEGVYLEDMPIVLGKNEPSRSDGCLVFLRNGTMKSESCESGDHPFICYKKYEQLVLNECGTVDDGYRRENGTTKCYKYHPESEKWEKAYTICKLEGAWLSTLTEKSFEQGRGTVDVAVGYKLIDGFWWDVHGKLSHKAKLGDDKCGSRTRKGDFRPVFCTYELSFVCEKKADNVQ